MLNALFSSKTKKAAVLALLAIAAAVVVITQYNKTVKINLNDYITYEVTGYDSYGRANVKFDTEKLIFDLECEKKVSDFTTLSLFYTVVEGVKTDINKSENLSNGDKIEIKIASNSENFKKIGVKVKASDISEKVKGLEKPAEFDPFDHMEIHFSGVNSNGKLTYTLDPDSEIIEALEQYISFSEENYLSNGDVVTVSVTANGYWINLTDSLLRKYGTVLTETEKEYTVSGLGEYAKKLSDINESTQKDIRKYTDENFQYYLENKIEYASERVNKEEYFGQFFFGTSDENEEVKNHVINVYRINITVFDGEGTETDTRDMFICYDCSNVWNTDEQSDYYSDGNPVHMDNYEFGGHYFYDAAASMDALEDVLIDRFGENYKMELAV